MARGFTDPRDLSGVIASLSLCLPTPALAHPAVDLVPGTDLLVGLPTNIAMGSLVLSEDGCHYYLRVVTSGNSVG